MQAQSVTAIMHVSTQNDMITGVGVSRRFVVRNHTTRGRLAGGPLADRIDTMFQSEASACGGGADVTHAG